MYRLIFLWSIIVISQCSIDDNDILNSREGYSLISNSGPNITFEIQSPYETFVLKEEENAVFVRRNASFLLTCTFHCYEIDDENCYPLEWKRSLLNNTSRYLPLPKQVNQSDTSRRLDPDSTLILKRSLKFISVQVETPSIYSCFAPTLAGHFLVNILEVKPKSNATLSTYTINETVVSSEPPVIYERLNLNESKPVLVSCEGLYKGDGTVKWYRTNQELTVKEFGRNNEIMEVVTVSTSTGANTTLHIYKPKVEHAAMYTCEFVVGTATSNASVYVHSPPLIAKFEKAKRAIQGDKLKVACKVNGYPKPETVVWYFHNVSGEWTGREGVTFEEEDGVQNAKLLFSSLQFEDRGVYWCGATNNFGQDMSGVLVRAKNRLDALWPFLGIVAEVAILVTIILIYEKKRSSVKKPAEVNGAAAGVGDHKDEEDAEADNKDADKEALRQRSVKA